MADSAEVGFVDGPKVVKVGESVYLAHRDNRDHYRNGTRVIEKIGRKYLFLKAENYYKFDIESGRNCGDYAGSCMLYSSHEAYDRAVLEEKIIYGVRNYFRSSYSELTYDQAIRIRVILDEGKSESP